MLTLCFPWDSTQMEATTEWRVWRQLRGAYGIGRIVAAPVIGTMKMVSAVEQYDTMSEAIASCTGQKIFLRPGGADRLLFLPTLAAVPDQVFIVGSSTENLAGLPGLGDLDVEIDSPNPVDLYGFNAAAMAVGWQFGRIAIGM